MQASASALGSLCGEAQALRVRLVQIEADQQRCQTPALCRRSGDVRTTVFLDPIVQGQIDAEHQAAHLLDRIAFTHSDPAALLVIDGELAAGQNAPASVA